MRPSFIMSLALGAIGVASLMTGPAGASAPARFTLHTVQHGASGCLQAQPGGGAGHMAVCDDSDGQNWDAYPTSGKYFALRNLNSDDICLESHTGLDANDPNGGAIYMADCGDFTGQNWYVEPVGNGQFKLKSEFAGPGKCLEGNSADPGAAINGASFMNDCQNVTGQVWTIGNGALVNGMPVAKN